MVRLLLTLGLLAGAAVPALAQHPSAAPSAPGGSRGTSEDERACRHDAVKFCKPVLGDDLAVLDCFQRNRRQLRPACEAVLRKYGQ